MAAATIHGLPEELLVSVLWHVGNPLDLVVCELVCRQWHALLRSRPTLWRDALHIDRGVYVAIPNPTDLSSWDGDNVGFGRGPGRQPNIPAAVDVFHKRIPALLTRSDGKLDRVAVRLTRTARGRSNEAAQLAELLPTLGAGEMWIECIESRGQNNAFVRSRWTSVQMNTDHHRDMPALPIVQGTLHALGQCGPPLRELRLVLNQSHFAFARSFAGMPIAQCTLTTLELECYDKGKLLDDDSLLLLLRHATYVKLLFMSAPVSKQWLWRLLQQSRLTLQHLEINVDLNAEDQHEPAIELPRLTSLHFRAHSPSNATACGRLICPGLRHLSWPQGSADALFESLLSPQLQTLIIVHPTHAAPSSANAEDALSLVHTRCSDIEELQLWHKNSRPLALLSEQLARLAAHRFVFFDVDLDGSEAVKLVQARQAQQGSRSITSIRIAHEGGLAPRHIQWLQRNVDDVQLQKYGGNRAERLRQERAEERRVQYALDPTTLLQRRGP